MKRPAKWYFLIFGLITIGLFVGYMSLRPVSKLAPAQEAQDITAQFSRTNQPRGWIGGDGGASIRLPDGRVLFLWADSFIGTVASSGKYDPFFKLVRNSLTTMRPDGSDFTTYINGTTGQESAYIPNVSNRPRNHLWPYSGMVANNKVMLLANEWQPDSTADFGSSFTGNTWLITLSLPNLAVESTTQIIANDQTQWGSTLYTEDDFTYVYGELAGKTYVYRVPQGQLNVAAEYSTADGWSADRSKARAISNQNIQAITKIDGKLHALYLKQPFPKVVSEASADKPEGPWRAVSKPVFTIPEAKNKKLLEYMPRIHESLSNDGSYVMSYSVNAYNIQDIPTNAAYYQPHFFKGPLKK